MVMNYVQNIYLGRAKELLGGLSPLRPPGYGSDWKCFPLPCFNKFVLTQKNVQLFCSLQNNTNPSV